MERCTEEQATVCNLLLIHSYPKPAETGGQVTGSQEIPAAGLSQKLPPVDLPPGTGSREMEREGSRGVAGMVTPAARGEKLNLSTAHQASPLQHE